MTTVQISYFEKARGLLWTEEINTSKLEETRLDAESKSENERAEAIEEALAKSSVEVDTYKHTVACYFAKS